MSKTFKHNYINLIEEVSLQENKTNTKNKIKTTNQNKNKHYICTFKKKSPAVTPIKCN